MEQIRFNYSLKNIGLPTHDAYRRNIIDKTEHLIKRMRWQAHFFLHGNPCDNNKNTFGLKSKESPPAVPELKHFEDDLVSMIENIEFRNINEPFMKTLEKDKRKIQSSSNVFISADKTRNLYEMKPATYEKLLTENITKTYKIGADDITDNINNELKTIADKLKITNRLEPMPQSQAFISLKDHKDDFENNTKCRLINPAKSQLGKVSKVILDDINTKVALKTGANQWRNTESTIAWFQSIENKDKHSFLSFDIVEFYPSITEELLDNAISWAQEITPITDEHINVIKHCRKSVLFNNGKAWVKKDNESNFDVTMGSYDGAEICELVGLFILSALEKRFGKNIGLYRDDGLALLNTCSGRLADKARKDLTSILKDFGLKITAQTNLKTVNFLDVTFDLTNGTFKPYRKPNNEPLYIHNQSNHPPSILKQLPNSISDRISKLSSDQETFNTAAPTYENALKHSNFDVTLTYKNNDHAETNENNTTTANRRRNRNRNVTWYNPPYSKNVKTNIGRNFLNLIDKHFSQSNKLHSLFNRNTVKVSYSCMENIQSIIQRHNNRILKNRNNSRTNTEKCNCRQNNSHQCPIPGNCLAKSIIYQAEVTAHDDGKIKKYIGMTANDFKQRYRNHLKSFRNEKHANETELSKHVWNLKREKRDFSIKWSIVKRAAAYRNGSRRCNLCLEEKLMIMKADKKTLLNKRSEIFAKCRHTINHRLTNVNKRSSHNNVIRTIINPPSILTTS